MTTHELTLLYDLAFVLLAALAGGLVAHLLRLPVVVGYLAAGLVVSPTTPGPGVSDVEQVRVLAELGVAFLMFGLGVQMSFQELAGLRKVALVGGGAQVVLTAAAGAALGLALGFPPTQSLFLGGALAISSTLVAMKVLSDRGELGSRHGQIVVAYSLVQDLAAVALVVVLPAVEAEAGSILPELGLAAAKAALLLAATYALGTRLAPWLFERVTGTGSRELFLLTVVGLALGLALGSAALDLSVAFGAFLAGLVVSESQYSYQTLSEVIPIRDIFSTLFFVSVGMLIPPEVLWEQPVQVFLVAGAAVLVKLVLLAGLTRALGYAAVVAVPVGVFMAHMGEFSFLVIQVGLDEGAVTPELNGVVLGAVLASIVVNPALVAALPALRSGAERLPRLRQEAPLGEERPEVGLTQHTVVLGGGRTGSELVEALLVRNLKVLVVERDPRMVKGLRSRGVPAIYGDAANPAILAHCRLERARVLAVTIPDAAVARASVAYARRVNPRIDIVVRAVRPAENQALRQMGAAEVVAPEFEAGLEFVRHTLHRYGVPTLELQAFLARRRADFYRPEG